MSISLTPGYSQFIADRQKLLDATDDPALKKHFQAEIDLVKSWGTSTPGISSPPGPGEQGAIMAAKPPGAEGAIQDPGSSGNPSLILQPPSVVPIKSDPAPKPVDSPALGAIDGTSGLGNNLPPALERYRTFIDSASKKTGVPADLLAGMIWDESRGDPNAGSTNGGNGFADTGLMQINGNTQTGTYSLLVAQHPELAGKDKNDPENNILAGAWLMVDMQKTMQSKYGRSDWDITLRAYNSGENGVDPNDLSHLPAGTGTASYVDKIRNYRTLIHEGGTLPA